MTNNQIPQSLTDLANQITAGPSLVPPIMTRIATTQMHPAPNYQLRRWIMRSSLGLAACLAVVFLVTFLTQPRIAFADVIDKLNQTHTLTFTDDDPDGPTRILIKSPDWMRVEQHDGSVMIWNKTTGQSVTLNPRKKIATKMVFARQPFDFYSWFKDFKDGKEERVGEKTLNGKHLLGFKITRIIPDFGANNKNFVVTLWVDPATNLPVQAQTMEDDHQVTFSDFHFDAPLDASLFDMTIPKGYKVTDLGGIPSDKLKPSPTPKEADSLTITPNVGVGNLHFGDSRDHILQLLGPPESIPNRLILGYPSKGLTLTIFPDRGLVSILLMSKQSFGPFAGNSFPGHTDKNIAMNSTRSQIEAAYGPPSSSKSYAQSMSMLTYDKLHTTFTLSHDQVIEILLQKP
ncbi:MAG TPA: hypothetical protein VFE58_17435 [Tepidisphaeraceae bacterium]|jgi:outer membrane lipoprotein-sorting protein|nr:hypothetical protein [Tepidisphaeraceae bacterium]